MRMCRLFCQRICTLTLIVMVGLAAGCSSNKATSGCTATSQCGSGNICFQNSCVKVCNTVADCGSGMSCESGMCFALSKSAPQINSISGCGDTNTNSGLAAICDRLVVDGGNLSGATFTLAGSSGQAQVLGLATKAVLGNDTSSHVELALTETSMSGHGEYTLTATNASGSCSAALTTLQGEQGLTGATGAIGPTGPQGPTGTPAGNAVGTGVVALGGASGLIDSNIYQGNNNQIGIGTQTPNSVLQVAGAVATAISKQAAAYTLAVTDSIVEADATSAGFTVTLPTAAGITGRVYTIKKIDSSTNAVTIATTGSQTIDGAPSKILVNQYQYIQVVSNGSEWDMIGTTGFTSCVQENGLGTATCPAGTVMTGGGCNAPEDSNTASIDGLESYPTGSGTWTCTYAVDISGGLVFYNQTAYAICCH